MKNSEKFSLLSLWPFAPIILVCFFSYYCYSSHFGFYEDDFAFVAQGISCGTNSKFECLKLITNGIVDPYHGRPLSFAHAIIFSSIGEGLFHAISGQYIIAFLIYVTCSVLVYIFCLQTWQRKDFSLLAALLFSIWPSDTNRALLTHVYIPMMGLLYFLCFAVFMSRNSRITATIFLALSLLTYEIGLFLAPFIFILFYNRNGKKNFSRFFSFFMPLVALYIAYTFMRWHLRDPRLAHATTDVFKITYRLFNSLLVGPAASLSAPFRFQIFHWITPYDLAICLGGLIVIFFALLFVGRNQTSLKKSFHFEPILFGLGITIFSYAIFAFSPDRYPPDRLQGRASGVHLSSLFGLSILLAAGIIILIDYVRRKPLFYKSTLLILSILLSLLIRMGLDVQNDFAQAWDSIKSRWSKILLEPLAFSTNSIVMVKIDYQINYSRHIQNFTNSEAYIFDQLYYLPSGFENKPRLVLVLQINFSPEDVPNFISNIANTKNLYWIEGDFEALSLMDPKQISKNIVWIEVNRDKITEKIIFEDHNIKNALPKAESQEFRLTSNASKRFYYYFVN